MPIPSELQALASGSTNAVVQEAGEDLGSLLGWAVEVKIKVGRLINRLEE